VVALGDILGRAAEVTGEGHARQGLG
jgi:hypothetical protein